jgi:subfamily B ATP-binding cassette protein MsbA
MNNGQLYLRLLSHVRPYWRRFAVSLLGMIVLALTEPAMPALIKPLLDQTFVAKDPQWIRLMPVLLIGLFIVRGVAQYISSISLAWVANQVVFDLRERMFARLIDLPIGYHATHTPGELMSRLNYDATQVTTAATNALVVAVRDSLAVAGLLAWMLYLDWKLALVFLLVAPVISVIVRTISSRLRRMSLALQRSMGGMTDVLGEAIRGNRVIKIYGGQAHERGRFHEVANWIRRYSMKIATASAVSVPLVHLVIVIALATVIYITAARADMTVGGFVSFFGAAAMLFAPIKRLTSLNEQIQRGLAASESIFRFLDERPEPDGGTRRVGRLSGRIEFVGVGLRYEPASEPVLSNISFRIEPGQTVALVGASGAGKSSMINLIPRFYSPTAGRILIDGIDIQEITLSDLRANIALVTQEVVLFNGTIASNIAYGVRHAGREEIVAAATAARIMDFAADLPEGLDTPIGDNGMRLSGGQRQRLAIARALLKDAPILIMDEATSAIDTQTERQVQDALDNLRRGRTTIIIAHRLSTVEKADRILVVDKGRIVESGRHRDLLVSGGLYADLYRAQFRQTETKVAQV